MLGFPDPALADDVVLLRPWRDDDLPVVAEASADAYMRFMSALPAPYDDAAGRRWLRRQEERAAAGEGLSLVVAERATDEAAGSAFLMMRRQGFAGIGYWLLPRGRGRGLAACAVRLLARWAIRDAGLRRVEALVEPWNEASQRVAEAAGMAREGLLRAYVPVDGRHADVIVYSLVEADLG